MKNDSENITLELEDVIGLIANYFYVSKEQIELCENDGTLYWKINIKKQQDKKN